MKDLDLSMVKLVQEHSAQLKREQERAIQEENQQLIEKFTGIVSESEKEKIRQRFYQNSIQTKEKTKKQGIRGKLYANKNRIKNLLIIVAGIATTLVIVKGVAISEEVSHYNKVLEQKMETELTDRQVEAYRNDHDNFISNTIEACQQIEEAKTSLNPEDYNLQGINITNHDNEYLTWDDDSFINLTEQTQDAIDIATDEVISEYRRRG